MKEQKHPSTQKLVLSKVNKIEVTIKKRIVLNQRR